MAEIFGPTPAEVRAALQQERLNTAALIGNMGSAGRAALGGGLLGQAIGEAFGAQDPRLEQAMALQQVQREIDQLGLEPGTPEFTRQTVARIRSRLGSEAAAMAFQRASALEQQRAAVEELRNAPEAQQRQLVGRAELLMRLGLPQEIAILSASDPRLTSELAKARLTPEEGTALQRDVAASGLKGEEAQKLMRRILEAKTKGGGITIINPPAGYTVNPENPSSVVPIPGGPADPSRLAPEEARANRDAARSIDSGIEAARSLVSQIRTGGASMVGGRARSMNILRGDLISAIAAMRNLGVLQPAELALMESQIPSVSGLQASAEAAVDPEFITAPLETFIERATQARGRLRLPSAEIFPARTSPGKRITARDVAPEDLPTLTDEQLRELIR